MASSFNVDALRHCHIFNEKGCASMMKKIGWIGLIKGKPYFEKTGDEYGPAEFERAEIFKKKKDALKRFEKVVPVYQ